MGDRFDEILRSARGVLVSGHVRPDGDCLGSQAALYHLLRALGKDVSVVNPDPLSPRYAFLGEETPFGAYDGARTEGGVPPYDALVVCDVSTLERTGPLAPILRARAAPRLVIDHHVPDSRESWDATYIDEDAPATGLLVWRLARRLGVSLPLPALRGVFVAVVTDTGWFRYSNTTQEALAVAAELVEGGVDAAALYRHLFQQFPAEWPRGVATLLSSLRYRADGRLAVVSADRAALRAAGAPSFDEADEVLDLLRAVGTVEVVLVFREMADGRVKAALRSKGDFDVNRLARAHGGGGHKKAAGFDVPGPFADSVARVEEIVAREVDAWKGAGRG
jgi:phosphoesterase RecJ-like protein